MLARLSDADIDAELKHLANWRLDANKTSILNEWEFDSFKKAMHFLFKSASWHRRTIIIQNLSPTTPR